MSNNYVEWTKKQFPVSLAVTILKCYCLIRLVCFICLFICPQFLYTGKTACQHVYARKSMKIILFYTDFTAYRNGLFILRRLTDSALMPYTDAIRTSTNNAGEADSPFVLGAYTDACAEFGFFCWNAVFVCQCLPL